MWMHMSGARWEVEGRVEERINNALHDAEQARLVRAVRGSQTRRTFRDLLNSARATLHAVNLRTRYLQLQEPTTCWQILAVLVILGLAALPLLGCNGAESAASPSPVPPTSVRLPRLDGQRVLFVVPDGFIDIEYRITRRILEEVGAIVTVASWSTDALLGSSGETLRPEVQIGDVDAGDFDAIVFVGGDHVKPTDPETQRLAKQAVAEDKVLGAICAGQGILKEAGLWEGGQGGVYLERRDRIIVASGAIKAREFGEAIATTLGE